MTEIDLFMGTHSKQVFFKLKGMDKLNKSHINGEYDLFFKVLKHFKKYKNNFNGLGRQIQKDGFDCLT